MWYKIIVFNKQKQNNRTVTCFNNDIKKLLNSCQIVKKDRRGYMFIYFKYFGCSNYYTFFFPFFLHVSMYLRWFVSLFVFYQYVYFHIVHINYFKWKKCLNHNSKCFFNKCYKLLLNMISKTHYFSIFWFVTFFSQLTIVNVLFSSIYNFPYRCISSMICTLSILTIYFKLFNMLIFLQPFLGFNNTLIIYNY